MKNKKLQRTLIKFLPVLKVLGFIALFLISGWLLVVVLILSAFSGGSGGYSGGSSGGTGRRNYDDHNYWARLQTMEDRKRGRDI